MCHKARKSNNPLENSTLCHDVTSVCKTSAVRIKIMISATDSYLISYITGVERTHSLLLLSVKL